ncbi:MAG: hydrolase [Nitrososphaerota archaeon]|nr:hydrolase [Nitrososphaerota archaeon]
MLLLKKANSRLIERNDTVLIVIDVQEKLVPLVIRNNEIISNIVKLIKFCKKLQIPIIITEQYPKGLGKTVREISEELQEIKPIEKTSFSCFGSEEFKKALRKIKAKTLILVGVEAHICIAQTALDALDRFRVCIVADAISSRSVENLNIGLQRMRDNGVIISSTEMLMYELLKDSKSKEFKDMKHLLQDSKFN